MPVTGDGEYRDPRWRWPEYDDDAVVELRVHGVGGEGPEGMTRDHHPVLVGGDENIGFWRARFPETHPRRRPGEPQRVREVVSWGGSTSGRRRSALWVLLLPFALFNAAGHMGPGNASDRRLEWHQMVCRLLALSLTLSLVAMTSAVAFDLVALQCAATEPCATAPVTGRWLLAPLRWTTGDVAATIAALALLPLAVVYGLRAVGRRQLARKPPLADPGDGDHLVRGSRHLHDADAWHNLWPAWRLRGTHITAGYAWVLLLLGRLLPVALPEASGALGLLAPLAIVALLAAAVLAGHWRVAGSKACPRYRTLVLAHRWIVLTPLGLAMGVALASVMQLRDRPALGIVLGVLAVAGGTWATWLHVRHVVVDDAGASGPSGGRRDVVLLVSAIVIGGLTGIDGGVRLAAPEVLDGLREAGPLLAPVVGDLPSAVYAPIWVLVGVQAVLLGALVVTSLGEGTRRTSGPPLPVTTVPFNLTAPVVALITMLLVSAIGAGLHAFVLDWLGTRVTDADEVVVEVVGGEDDVALGTQDATDDGGTDDTTDEGGGAVSDEEAAEDGTATAAVGDEEVTDVEVAVAEVTDPRAEIGLVLPWWYVLTAQVVVVTVVLLAVVVLALRAWLRRVGSPSPGQVREAMARSLDGLLSDHRLDEARRVTVETVVGRTREQWLLQALVRRAGAVLGAVALAMLVILTVFVAVVGIDDLATTRLPGATVALLLVALIPPGAVLLLRAAREDRLVRRQIGALWDVLCFWPRVTHPFAPPSYGEAVVPAVVERLNRYPAGATVVLAGHSQGSVIALAAAVSPALEQRRLHLVTYGSPLSLLYEGFYPSVFGDDDGAIARATPTTTGNPTSPLTTWHNVLSVTEPIGTPLWHASDTGESTDADSFGWPLRLRLPWEACPACAYARPGASPAGDRRPAVDVTITDPDRVLSPSHEVDGTPTGHSSYHRSRELDEHLASLR